MMVDTTIEEIATASPVVSALTGEEPIETEIASIGQAFRLRQLSSTPLSPQTSSYQLVLTDQGKCVTMDSGSSNSLTVPADATIDFPIGATILIRQIGSGLTTILPAGGVTIQKRITVGFDLVGQFAQCVLHKVAINTWQLAGELATI